jgi:hypothetical protein
MTSYDEMSLREATCPRCKHRLRARLVHEAAEGQLVKRLAKWCHECLADPSAPALGTYACPGCNRSTPHRHAAPAFLMEQRAALNGLGLSPQEVDRAMQPALSFDDVLLSESIAPTRKDTNG